MFKRKCRNPFLNDSFILVLILLNAWVLFFQCYDEKSVLLRTLDVGLMFCFLLEMFFKHRLLGWCGYWCDSWNRFDGTITLLSSLSLLQFFCPSGTGIPLGFLIALRVFRVFRFFLILRFIPSIDSIVSGTRRAIKSSYVILIAFGVISFIVSLISCCIYRHISPEYFGNPVRSFYSIFRLFTVEGWYEIPNTISDACSNGLCGAATKIYFIFLLFAGGIIGMSFINSIIVDAMVSDNNDDLIREINVLEHKIDALSEQISSASSPASPSSAASSDEQKPSV